MDPPLHMKCDIREETVPLTYGCKVSCLDSSTAGADPGFFLGGGALVSCSTWGVRTLSTLPLDPPLHSMEFHHYITELFSQNSIVRFDVD